jgi:hypothetical protein
VAVGVFTVDIGSVDVVFVVAAANVRSEDLGTVGGPGVVIVASGITCTDAERCTSG